jgi:hypothetical protein
MFVALVAVVAVVALEADVAVVAVAALPLMDMPHVPEAPDPVVDGAPTVLYEIVRAVEPLKVEPDVAPVPLLLIVSALATDPAEPLMLPLIAVPGIVVEDVTALAPLPYKYPVNPVARVGIVNTPAALIVAASVEPELTTK